MKTKKKWIAAVIGVVAVLSFVVHLYLATHLDQAEEIRFNYRVYRKGQPDFVVAVQKARSVLYVFVGLDFVVGLVAQWIFLRTAAAKPVVAHTRGDGICP